MADNPSAVDEEARQQIANTTARVLAIRDVVARLLAYEAMRQDNLRGFWENFSDSTGARIHHVTGGRPVDGPTMQLQETIQREVDWMVAAARKMLPEAGEE